MNMHKNARLTYHGRCHLVKLWQAGKTPLSISRAVGVSTATLYKWIHRYKQEGEVGLRDRSSRPHKLNTKVTAEQILSLEELRRQRTSFWKIAHKIGISTATAARIGKMKGLSRLSSLEPKEPIIRYEKAFPGEMIHIDIKKLGRIEGIGHRITGNRKGASNPRSRKSGGHGWEYLHLAVDDHSRLAYSELFPDEKRISCLKFLRNALRFFKRHGVALKCVMTDNGVSFRSHRYAKVLRSLNIKHVKTRPYTPKTNGKVERFVQTSLREWAYRKPYQSSQQRKENLLPFLKHYNHHRPHFGINKKTPISRISVNNLSRHHT